MTTTETGTIPSPSPLELPSALTEAEVKELDDLLDALRESDEEVPMWDYCDGFLTALVCTRDAIPVTDWLPMLLGNGLALEDVAEGHPLPLVAPFTDAAQQQRFIDLCARRMAQAAAQLDLEIDSLDDDNAFIPEVLDIRGAIAALPPEERDVPAEDAPAFAQLWAMGFIMVTLTWTQEWAAPRDKETAQWLEESLDNIRQLTEDDTAKATMNLHDEAGPPSVSEQRIDTYGRAIWSIYDLRQLWKSLGPRLLPMVQPPKPGRNDLCWCGSGKKFKKCHGV